MVTRPREQASGLAALVQQAGGRAFVFPAIEIHDPEDLSPALSIARRLEEFHLAVFVSPTAAQRAARLVGRWPAALPAAAVGRGSAAELRRQGFASVVAPDEGADSEALLSRPELRDVAGKRIVLFRGEGGRTLLAETLAARGAHVEQAVCYRRMRPVADPAPLLAAWREGRVHAVAVSSSEGTANLHAMLGEGAAALFRRTPFFAAHERVALEARRLGALTAVAAGATDEEVLDRLVAYFADHE